MAGRRFIWTPERERAVTLEYGGRLTQRQIAARIGVTRRTVEGWMRRKAVRARLEELQAEGRRATAAYWRERVRKFVAEHPIPAEDGAILRSSLVRAHARRCQRKEPS